MSLFRSRGIDYSNQQIAALFENLAFLLERKGDLIFKVRSYRRVAQVISGLPTPLVEVVRRGENLRQLSGVGPAIAKKIEELVTTGRVQTYERVKAEVGAEALDPIERER